METTLASTIIAKARARTDTETASPTTDHITDAFLLDRLHDGYRELVDLVVDTAGDTAVTLFGSHVDLVAGSGVLELPNSVYRILDIRKQSGTRWVPLKTSQFAAMQDAGSSEWPTYKHTGGTVTLEPSDATGTYRVWYVPTVAAPSAATALNTVSGWDAFLVAYLCLEIAARSDLPEATHDKYMQRAVDRIRKACLAFTLGETVTLRRVEVYAEDVFDWGF
jgi:hypothetical protein